MNIYDVIKRIQMRMSDPVFAAKFNQASNLMSTIPGLQQEVFRIAQMQDEKAQSAAIARLPKEAKDAVQELINMLK